MHRSGTDSVGGDTRAPRGWSCFFAESTVEVVLRCYLYTVYFLPFLRFLPGIFIYVFRLPRCVVAQDQFGSILLPAVCDAGYKPIMSGFDDFSNNLVTDLGPLLSLMGDSMTKQFIAESTDLVDYLIFALGPVGIVTAIVSVIRLSGSAPL